jgi:transposase InsO family protein
MTTSHATLETNTIKRMLNYVAEYESVKTKTHPEFIHVRTFFASKGICYQNFYKFYARFIAADRDPQKLLPTRRGPKPKYVDMPILDDSLPAKVLEYRKSGLNKFVIAEALKRDKTIKNPCSASTVYRILRTYGESKMSKTLVEEKRKIVREYAGSLAHVDCHYLPKGVVQCEPNKRFYVLGLIDDFSRIVWVEVMNSVKALDATFAMMDAIMIVNQRYGIKYDEILSDNGSEFCSKSSEHPFERLLQHFDIKHRKTKPYRPQTNGKIERFWRTFHDDVIEGTVFQTLDELKDAVLGYNFYYNEHRPHQGIQGKIPFSKLSKEEKEGKKLN